MHTELRHPKITFYETYLIVSKVLIMVSVCAYVLLKVFLKRVQLQVSLCFIVRVHNISSFKAKKKQEERQRENEKEKRDVLADTACI